MADQAERLRLMVQGRPPRAGQGGKGSRVIAVASGKGGVGKTNLVVNMGIIMGQLGHKIVILDMDLGMANTDILMDLKPIYTLVDVIRGQKVLSEVLIQGPHNVEVLPGGSCLPELISMDNQQRERLISRLSYLDQEGKILLLDCSAGFSRDVLDFVALANDLVLVTTPEPTAITDAYGIIKILNNYRLKPKVSMVINMVQHARDGEAVYQRISNVCSKFLGMQINYLGSIEFDQSVQKAVQSCYPYVLQFPRSRAALLTREITQRLFDGEEQNIKKEEGFLYRLFSFWKADSKGNI
ncbi:MAG: MinD/ParA family protein [Dethiobacteria bacterium]|jgi:flagellar biosynthesis protein FlhG